MRTLEIIFWGLALFVEQGPASDRTYQVLLPDTRKEHTHKIAAHEPAIWVRPRSLEHAGNWKESPDKGDFTIEKPCELIFEGSTKTDLEYKLYFDNRLPDGRESDELFTLDPAGGERIAWMTIDRGTLSSHEFPRGMIAVRWVVEIPDRARPSISCGGNTIQLHPDTKQVFVANSASTRDKKNNHFRLYRKLSTDKSCNLTVRYPSEKPLPEIRLDEPSDSYAREIPEAGDLRTPFRDCSGAVLRQ